MHEEYCNSLTEMRDNYRNSMDRLIAEHDKGLDQLKAEHERMDQLKAQQDGMKKELVERFESRITFFERTFSKLPTESPRKAGRWSQDDDN